MVKLARWEAGTRGAGERDEGEKYSVNYIGGTSPHGVSQYGRYA